MGSVCSETRSVRGFSLSHSGLGGLRLGVILLLRWAMVLLLVAKRQELSENMYWNGSSLVTKGTKLTFEFAFSHNRIAMVDVAAVAALLHVTVVKY